MGDPGPPELRSLDTSRARKDVVLTRTAHDGPTPDAKAGGAERRGRILGLGLLGTSLVSLGATLAVGWLAGGAILGVGLVATFVATARAVEAPPAPTPDRFQALHARLIEADLPPAAESELRGALDELRAARDRDTKALEVLDRSLAELDGDGLARQLATAEERGDATEIALRRQALAAHQGLVDRHGQLRKGEARATAALDALELALAQAAGAAAGDSSTVEADSQRLQDQVTALRRATDELDALDAQADRARPGTERA